jgi:hypothetical protein
VNETVSEMIFVTCSCGVETAATGAAYVGSATVVGDEAPAPVADELRHRRRCLGVAPRHACRFGARIS